MSGRLLNINLIPSIHFESSLGTPTAFLNNLIGLPVTVKLNSGVDYKGFSSTSSLWTFWIPLTTFNSGTLTCLDGYMNIALENTEEYVLGQRKAKYGDTFIRGNNGT
jgi:U6 snRNA-associated Sm-like protein LSm6